MVLLIVLTLVASACGGGSAESGESFGSGQARELAAPEVDAGPTTTLKPLERIVLGEQLPDLKMPPPGSTYDPSLTLNGTGTCGNYFRLMLDDAFWTSGTEPERFTDLIAQLDDPAGPDLTARLLAAADPLDVEALAQAYEGLDALTMRDCGQPGAGALFVISGTTSAGVYPDLLPCLMASGATWADLATGLELPWHPVDCDSGELVVWDDTAQAWTSPQEQLSSAEQQFNAVDEALG